MKLLPQEHFRWISKKPKISWRWRESQLSQAAIDVLRERPIRLFWIWIDPTMQFGYFARRITFSHDYLDRVLFQVVWPD